MSELTETPSTRERIHDAALRVFHRAGYSGATVRDVADACGLSPGALYNHYAAKDELLFAIVDRFHDLADETLAGALARGGAGARECLDALVRAFVALHIAHPLHTRVANRDYIYLPDAQRARIVQRRRRIRETFAEALRAGEREGVFRLAELGSEDAVTAASMAILNMVVQVGEWFSERGPESAEEVAALHARLALRVAGA